MRVEFMFYNESGDKMLVRFHKEDVIAVEEPITDSGGCVVLRSGTKYWTDLKQIPHFLELIGWDK